MKPKFSIIVAHHQPSVNQETIQRLINSLKNQTYKDFEIIIVHDGPYTEEPNYDFGTLNYCLYSTEKHEGIWGHNSRDYGLTKAKGKYILHTNADNLYYPTALEDINQALKHNPICTFAVKFIGMCHRMKGDKVNIYYTNPRDPNYSTILLGHPGVVTDVMQVVMPLKIWQKYGGWYDKREDSDKHIYKKILTKEGYYRSRKIIGEHW